MNSIMVNIKWDKSDDPDWLCPENIEMALRTFCPKTNFTIEDITEWVNGLVQ